MTQDQWMSLIRTLFKVGGGIAVTKGYGDSNGWEEIGGAVLTIVGVIWSFWNHAAPAPVPPPTPPAVKVS